MPIVGSGNFTSRSQRWLPLLLAMLLGGCVAVLWPLASAIVWAVVLAYVTWPLYRLIRRWLREADTLAAFLTTAVVSAAVILPVLWVALLVHSELVGAFRTISAWLTRAPFLIPAAVRVIPIFGPRISSSLTTFFGNPNITGAQLAAWLQQLAGPAMALLGSIGRNVGKLVVSLFILFFLYRDGDRIRAQSVRVMGRIGLRRLEPYLTAAGAMTRAVIY